MRQLREAYDKVTSFNGVKLNQAFTHNGWKVIINYYNGRFEVTTFRDGDDIGGASWKGFRRGDSTYEKIETYLIERSKGELRNKRSKACRSHILLLS